jgi:type VI secretion system secreted protein Hcp
MPIYMNYDGIKGSVTEEGHKEWVELQSCQFGASRPISTTPGQGVNRAGSAASVSEIMSTKSLDKSSVNLFKTAVGNGEGGKKCVIDFCRMEGNKMEVYLTITMEDTLISSHTISAHGGDAHSQPMESFSLNFTKIEFAMTNRDSKDKSGAKDRANFNLATGKSG